MLENDSDLLIGRPTIHLPNKVEARPHHTTEAKIIHQRGFKKKL
jgi:hypothetical protein